MFNAIAFFVVIAGGVISLVSILSAALSHNKVMLKYWSGGLAVCLCFLATYLRCMNKAGTVFFTVLGMIITIITVRWYFKNSDSSNKHQTLNKKK